MDSGKFLPLLRKALGMHQAGRAGAAAGVLQELLRLAPDMVQGWELLGFCLMDAGDATRAAGALQQALKLGAGEDAAMGLARLHAESGRLAEARAVLEQAMARLGRIPRLLTELGDVLAQQGNHAAAAALYQESLSLQPDQPTALNNLASSLRAQGCVEQAVQTYRTLLHAAPEDGAAWASLAGALLDAGELEEALQTAQRAVDLAPQSPAAWSVLGGALAGLDMEGPEEAYAKALELDPADGLAAYNLASFYAYRMRKNQALKWVETALQRNLRDDARAEAQRLRGSLLAGARRPQEAQQAFASAQRLRPESIFIRYSACMAHLALSYPDEDALREARERYGRCLNELREKQLADPEGFARAAGQCVGAAQPFFLAYQGLCDRDLQDVYGRMIHDLHARLHGELVPRHWPKADGKIRVGIVSGYFHQHSNWKMRIKGWLDEFDKERFELYGYHAGRGRDHNTVYAEQHCHCFRQIRSNWKELARAVVDDAPHALIYPEIGMHPETLRLAALRLAPVQCATWGHPDTSGLPTMDYYLTSVSMESEDCREHYTEKPVLLPQLSVSYQPLPVDTTSAARSDFGLAAGRQVFLCAQSLPKYLPRHDGIYPRIAEQLPESLFVFIQSHIAGGVTAMVLERLRAAFAARGLDMERHVRFLPQMSLERFHCLCRVADLCLDTPEWSGCNSVLEALQQGLPVVTLPGPLMRGRHGLAILRQIGCEQAIAWTVEEYVALAVALMRDTERRRALAAHIEQNRRLLYSNVEPVRALEEFLVQALRGRGLS